MNYKKHFLLGMSILFIMCFLSGVAIAYDDNGTYFTCDNCSDCTNALNNNTYNEVRLGADIINHSGDCIFNPAGFNNKIFDGQNHTIDGDGTGYAFRLASKSGYTIKNCVITDFYDGMRLDGSSFAVITNNTISSANAMAIYFYSGSVHDIEITDNNISNIGTVGICIHAVTTDHYNITISGNTIQTADCGIGVVSEDSTIANNIIHDISTSTGGICIKSGSSNCLVDNNTIYDVYIAMSDKGANTTITNNTITTGISHGGLYISGDGGTVQNNDISNLDFGSGPPSGSNYLVRDNDLGSVELKGGQGNTIIYNTISGRLSAAGIYCKQEVHNNNISNNTFTTAEVAIGFASSWASYNNTVSSNTFNSANDYAITLCNSTNNTIEDNNASSAQNFIFLETTTSGSKGCGNIGSIVDSGTNYVSNTSQSCYIWGKENLDNTGRLSCNKAYIVGIDFQPDFFSLRTSGLTLKDKNLNNMMFLQAYPSNASLNVTLTSWNSTLKKYDEVGIGTYLKYAINTSEVGKNYTINIYAHSNDSKMQTFYITSNSSGYVVYNTTGFAYDRYTTITSIEEPISILIVVSVIGAVAAGGAYIIRKWKKR